MTRALRSITFGLLFGASVCAANAFAAEPHSLPVEGAGSLLTGPDVYTLDRLQQLALANNPTLEQARSETWKAHGRYQQAGLYPNPEFSFQAAEIGNDGRAGQQGIFFQQEFVTGCKLQLSQSIEVSAQRQARHTVTAQEYRVANGVRQEFYAVLTAQRNLELSQSLLDIARKAEAAAQRRLEGLQGSKVDLLQARVERQRSELEVANSELVLEGALRRLQTLTGIPIATEQIAGALEEQVPNLEWESTWSRLQELSPQIARAEAGIARAQAVWQRQRAEPIPNVTVQAGTQYDFGTSTQIAGVQVSVPVPIFNRNQGNIAAAEAEWVRAAREVERLRLALRQSLADAYRDYATSRTRVVRLNQEILPASLETLELSRTLLDGGELTYLEFLTVQRNYTRLNQEYVSALGDLWRTVVAIDGLLLVDGLQAPEPVE